MKKPYVFFLSCVVSICLISCKKGPASMVDVAQRPDKANVTSPKKSYSSSFNLHENPISEGGKWINGMTVGLDWTDVKTEGGVAKGNSNFVKRVTGVANENSDIPNWVRDPTALLTGTWGPDQTVEGTVSCPSNTPDGSMEIEARLRSSLSPHNSSGYEVTFTCNFTPPIFLMLHRGPLPYILIVRWNGPVNDYTFLAQPRDAFFGVHSGDVVKATIVGNVITAYINGVQKAQVTDSTYKTGSPGIGFDNVVQGTNELFGFTDISISATGD